MQLVFLLLLCIAADTVKAATPVTKPCVSTFKAVTNYNATQFAGTWYEVRQILPAPRGEGSCEAAKYKANPDKTLSVIRVWVDTAGKPQKLSGTIKTSGANPTDAQLTVTFGKTSNLYTIFHLNYHTVFGVYTCIDKTAYVFVFAKTQKVDDSELKDIYSAMAASGLEPHLLKLSPRTGCPAV